MRQLEPRYVWPLPSVGPSGSVTARRSDERQIAVVDPLGHVAGEIVEAERDSAGTAPARRPPGIRPCDRRARRLTTRSASLPPKFAVPDTTGRSAPQGYLSGLPVLAARATNSHSRFGRQAVAVGHGHRQREAAAVAAGWYAGGRPSCADSQLQNSAASSQVTRDTGCLSRSSETLPTAPELCAALELAELRVGDLAFAHVERPQQRHLVRALVRTAALLAAVGARLVHAARRR